MTLAGPGAAVLYGDRGGRLAVLPPEQLDRCVGENEAPGDCRADAGDDDKQRPERLFDRRCLELYYLLRFVVTHGRSSFVGT